MHLQPTPRMGGLGMYFGLRRDISGFAATRADKGFRLLLGHACRRRRGGIIMIVGLIDDKWGLDALTKFAGQVTAASVLVTMGVAWSMIYIPFGGVGTIVLDQMSSILVTLALTVSIVNAMNFVDGLDGLAAGLGLITAAAICIFSIAAAQSRWRRPVLPARGDLGRVGRGLPGLPSAQLPSGADLHG